MIRTILIEEDKDRRNGMTELIRENCPDVFILSICEKPECVFQVLEDQEPELVIANVSYSHGDIFNLLINKLNEITFRIIFTADTSSFAVEAIKIDAVDYLLFPLNIKNVVNSIEQAKDKIEEDMILQSYLISKSLFNQDKALRKLFIKTPTGIILIPVGDIIYCEGMEGRCLFYVKGGVKYATTDPLMNFSRQLKDQGFIKINKSFLINGSYMERYDKTDGGYIVMKEVGKIPLSERAREQFNRVFRSIA